MYLEYLKLCLKLYRNLNIYLTHIPDILFNFENLDLVWLAICLTEPDIAVGKSQKPDLARIGKEKNWEYTGSRGRRSRSQGKLQKAKTGEEQKISAECRRSL